MHWQIKLFGGTLKVKTGRYLRTAESNREVPVFRFGRYFVIWWPNGKSLD